MRKPVLGICYGLQSLNVYRSGSLIQHIPDFLPQDLRTTVNHEAGKTVKVAHKVDNRAPIGAGGDRTGSLPAKIQFLAGRGCGPPDASGLPGRERNRRNSSKFLSPSIGGRDRRRPKSGGALC